MHDMFWVSGRSALLQPSRHSFHNISENSRAKIFLIDAICDGAHALVHGNGFNPQGMEISRRFRAFPGMRTH